jgi:hypothetical protein
MHEWYPLTTDVRDWRKRKMKCVIPDLVSEERAESVGNPCLDIGDSKA